ncbi:hypothetical protein C5167_036519 [Papaver somniferum]|uniref:Uncharacterized protein n=1 Tax=Papaver somniferum TaxID=3469 RepID=A0A4Y7I7A6_PAPSO|nr:hypothetical protein C5167_036519 [Papaver somniferum]
MLELICVSKYNTCFPCSKSFLGKLLRCFYTIYSASEVIISSATSSYTSEGKKMTASGKNGRLRSAASTSSSHSYNQHLQEMLCLIIKDGKSVRYSCIILKTLGIILCNLLCSVQLGSCPDKGNHLQDFIKMLKKRWRSPSQIAF